MSYYAMYEKCGIVSHKKNCGECDRIDQSILGRTLSNNTMIRLKDIETCSALVPNLYIYRDESIYQY